ncbi:hypothetical protein L211DRAFT_265879 [Terfezia boudieri ATCC MYA-4762]|uniref:Uncharacterized protein n=1 Tax=Terfezia boudieri ATCC MYA-4762 TaxID=1051890 RepID=A0A3N4MAP0_9PEZI|nr:hypothetical protein L211DRAFT_265879 [Terfezia boudieri ATCC MYA-4762]
MVEVGIAEPIVTVYGDYVCLTLEAPAMIWISLAMDLSLRKNGKVDSEVTVNHCARLENFFTISQYACLCPLVYHLVSA